MTHSPASWVIVSATTGKAIVETFDAGKAAWVNANASSQARAVPIGEYLAGLNTPEIAPHSAPSPYRQELTPEGVQYVIPGCERVPVAKSGAAQL